MEPFLWEGDVVQLAESDHPEPGKIYAFSLDGRSVVAHRLKEIRGTSLIFQGDRQPEGEQLEATQNTILLARLLDRYRDPPAEILLLALVGLLARRGPFKTIPNSTLRWPWEKLLQLAQKHRLLSVIGYVLKESGLWQEAPEFARQILLHAIQQDIARSERISSTIQDLRHLLPEMRLLKGAELRAVYPQDFLRTMHDVDVLVDEYLPVLETLSKNGFHWSQADREKAGFYHQSSVTHQHTGILVEIHSTLFQPHRYRFDSRPYLQGKEDPAALVVYLCAHGVSHWGQHGISMLDIFLLLERNREYTSQLGKRAKASGAIIATAFVLQGIHEWWNKDYRAAVLKELSAAQRVRLWIATQFFLHRFDIEMMSFGKRLLQFLLADNSFQFLKLFLDPGRRRLAKGNQGS